MKLAEPGAGEAEFNFKHGRTYVWTSQGWRLVAGRFGVRYHIVQFCYRATRWWRPRTICNAVDVEHGIITLNRQRWSWLRWRWE